MKEQKTSVADLRPWANPGEQPFVSLSNLGKKFGETAAVKNFDLDIYKGELFCLLGGSGSGKSTLLRLLAGFESPDTGTITIDSTDMANVIPPDRPVNMMFQSYALFPHMSVAANIGYGLKRMGLDKATINNRVDELLALLKLTSLASRRPHQLSGGQKQRVALARALARQPKLLLLDEPLGALDKELRTRTQFELIKIQEALGVTFIVVTHDPEEAMSLATRIGIMNEGKIVQIGEPREIYENPNSRYVAKIVGSINIFSGHIAKSANGTFRFLSDELALPIKTEPTDMPENQKAWFAIRPEKIRLTRQKPKGDFNAIKGMVDEVIYLGDNSLYRLVLDNGHHIMVSRPNSEHGQKGEISWDETAYAVWPPNAGSVLFS